MVFSENLAEMVANPTEIVRAKLFLHKTHGNDYKPNRFLPKPMVFDKNPTEMMANPSEIVFCYWQLVFFPLNFAFLL